MRRRLTFLGAAGTVTGSRYLLELDGRRILVDCGLFQGYKQLRLRNWSALSFDPPSIEAVVLTHAHIDHSGYLPLLVKRGFTGRIFCSQATLELCRILLPDSGHLQEEEAKFANRRGFSKHKPALPLYTRSDAETCLKRFEPVEIGCGFEPAPGVKVELRPAGHILGATFARLEHQGLSITFTGDLGRATDPVMKPPAIPAPTDFLVTESTYGDRKHPPLDPQTELGQWLAGACARGGVTVIPAFAVGRTQALMLHIARLKQRRALPDIPVYLDSPMAIDATALYQRFNREHRLTEEECREMCQAAQLINTPEQSKALDQRGGPMIILSASGMATGGRVVHHLTAFAGDARNLILLSGFQAAGTRGAALAAGAGSIHIHGQEVAVKAQVGQLAASSAHADADELLAWMRNLPAAPRQTFVTHGEPHASDSLRYRIDHELGWNVMVPEHQEGVDLDQFTATTVASRPS